jgi:hypothetical protein
LAQNDEVSSTWRARVAPARTFSISSWHVPVPTCSVPGPFGVAGALEPADVGVEVPSFEGTELGSTVGCDGALDAPPSPVTGRPSGSESPALIAQ